MQDITTKSSAYAKYTNFFNEIGALVESNGIVDLDEYVAKFFFFNGQATPEIYTAQYTLSLHDALPISRNGEPFGEIGLVQSGDVAWKDQKGDRKSTRLNSSHIEPSRMPSSA